MSRRPIRLNLLDAQILAELLDDLEAKPGQLPPVDGDAVGYRKLLPEEKRAIRTLRLQIFNELGIPRS